MTATEKYLNINHAFIQLRDAVFESNVVEKDEDPEWENRIMIAFSVFDEYLKYYKENNKIKTYVKGEENKGNEKG